MRLAWTALKGPYPGGKQPVLELVKCVTLGDLGGALEYAYVYLAQIQGERAHAEAAAELLERWAQGAATDATAQVLQIGAVAKLLGVSTDVLRNWERNGLIKVPRNPRNGYRLYGAAEIGRLRVIRTLSRAGYGLMAILRMLLHLGRGGQDLRHALDTPDPDEDICYATDRWLSTLAEQEQRALDVIVQLEALIDKRQK
jgi:DNA-binding transcriptional MerR regulator